MVDHGDGENGCSAKDRHFPHAALEADTRLFMCGTPSLNARSSAFGSVDERRHPFRLDCASYLVNRLLVVLWRSMFGLMWWLDDKTRLSGEELNALFQRFAIPAVKATLRD
jgi:hypothetical protein